MQFSRLRSQSGGFSWLILLGLLVILLLIFAFPTRTFSDIGAVLELGKRIARGQLPYVHFEDFNLPTIQYINAIPVLVSNVLPVNQITLYFLLVWLELVFASAAIIRISRDALEPSDHIGRTIIVIMLIVQSMLSVMLITYGQREYLILVMFLPWFVLRWHRWNGGSSQPALAFAVGFAACVGASIKPQFVPLFIAGDLYWLITKRTLRPLLEPEIYGSLLFLTIYGVYFWIISPQIMERYLNYIFPLTLHGYDVAGDRPVLEILLEHFSLVEAFIYLVLPWLLPRIPTARLWDIARPFTLVVVAAIIGFILPKKGWDYHRVVLDGCRLMFIGLYFYYAVHWYNQKIIPFLQRRAKISRAAFLTAKRLPSIIVISTYIAMLISGSLFTFNTANVARNEKFIELLENYSKRGDYILTIDTVGSPTYPNLERINRHQASRYNIAFPIMFSYYQRNITDIYTPHHKVPGYVQQYLDHLVEDIKLYQPPLIFIRQGQCDFCSEGLDLFKYLEARQILSAVINPSYDFLQNMGAMRVYRHK